MKMVIFNYGIYNMNQYTNLQLIKLTVGIFQLFKYSNWMKITSYQILMEKKVYDSGNLQKITAK